MANLEELMTNIDKLDANNPADMEALVQAISAGAVDPIEGTAPAKADEKAVDIKAADTTEPDATKADATPVDPAIEDKAPVATRDGKHTIPYTVLEAARAAKDKAEADARQEREQREAVAKKLDETLARLKELEATAGAAKTTEQEAEASDLKADLEAIANEAPYLANVLGKLITRVEATEKLASEVSRQPNNENTLPPSMPTDLRDAMDAVPALAHWEASDAKLFAAAVEVDDRLKMRPEWANKPMAERFAKVVDVMRAEYGDSILPPTESSNTPTPAAKTLPKADEAAINSISDLTGGTPTAQNALQDMESASPTALFNKLQAMESPEDILRFVTR